MSNKTPPKPGDIYEHIVHHTGFSDGLAYVSDFMRSETSSTLIVRGDTGCGKKTVVMQAEDLLKGKAICIYLDRILHSDDFFLIKTIAKRLGLEKGPSIPEMIADIQELSGRWPTKKKIVIVLSHFEEFCKRKQSLLYTLTHLTQHGKNISLIGLTMSLDCIEHLEKRVRSRMNALFYELKPPYENKEEYVSFASILLGKYRITGKLKEQLEYMYMVGHRSIKQLKSYLISICDWDEKGKFIVNEPTEIFDLKNDPKAVNRRLQSLSRPHLELLKMIVCCCDSYDQTHFTPNLLSSYANNHEYHTFDAKSDLSVENMIFLIQCGFLKVMKPQQGLHRKTTLSIHITPIELKQILQRDLTLHFGKSDLLWKRIVT